MEGVRLVRLQVALDLLEKNKALEIAKKCSEAGAHIIEAGTPLIKSEGIGVVTDLKRIAPGRKIVADMKTMDTGYLETKLAAEAGADMVSILGAADNNTIREALKAGREFGVEIVCDLINVQNPVERAKELERMGVDYVALHLGIDQQKNSEYPYPILRKLCEELRIPVVAAGGLDDEKVVEVARAGAEIVIVGSFITKSDDPGLATKRIMNVLR